MKKRSIVLLLLSGILGCGDQGTTGKRVLLHTRVTSDLGADHTVVTALGWTVRIDSAVFSTGPFYYYDGEPAFTQVEPSRLKMFWEALAPIQTAYAHPGHYVAGNAKGEQLTAFSVDLLAGPADLPDGDGVSGMFRSATFSFSSPSAGPVASMLDGHVAVVHGLASKDGKDIHFAAVADMADVEKTAKDAQITGCIFHEADVEDDGTVTVTVKPRVWFNLVDFSDVAPGTAEAPTTLEPDSTSRIGFALGLGQLSAYELAYSTP